MTTAVRCARAASDHRVDVLEIPEGHDAGQPGSRHRKHDRPGARGEQQPVVFHFDSGARSHAPAEAIDPDHRIADVQRDPALGIPRGRVRDDVDQAVLPREQRGEQDAVVAAVRLGAEDDDVVGIGCELEQLLDRAHRRHAVADDDEAPARRRRPAGHGLAPHPVAPSLTRASQVGTARPASSRQRPDTRLK